ncbi:MAG: glycosyltransferase family 1 protein [Campylobacteraceae bacterium]|nr:glycosyltransferase family 1 protein [Campylobacteraceae bacterium]
MKTKVIYLVGLMNGGGVESVIMNYALNLDRDKFEFVFLTSESSTRVPYEKIKSLNAELILLPDYYKAKKEYIKKLFEVLKKNRDAIFHCNYLSPLPFFIAKFAGVKNIIAHSHAFQERVNFKHKIRRFLVSSFANRYFACGQKAGEYVFKNKPFAIINNAINLERFKFSENTRESLKKELNLEDKIVIGHIGRFSFEKNHKFLLDIFKKVLDKNPSFHLVLVGDGELFSEAKEQAKSLEIYENISFIGNSDKANEYYNSFDIFVLPSLHEGFGMVLVEAQANGLKCLASTGVSKETQILSNLEFLELDSEIWSEKILNANLKREENSLEMVKNRGFDIATEAKKLEQIYLEFV